MDIVIIIVTHNNASTLDLCLTSLSKSEYIDKARVVIVDNNSTDETRDIIKKWINIMKNWKAVFLNKNVGFPKAIMIGLKDANPKDYFAMLNPDAIPTRKWLVTLLNAMETCKTCGMAGSLLVHLDGSIDSAGGFLNFFGYPIEAKFPLSNKPYEVQYAKGAATLVHVSAYRLVGGFNPRFFFYYDETELAIRMRKHGFKVIVVPNSIVFHVGQGSKIRHKELFTLYYMERNRLLYICKTNLLKMPIGIFTAIIGIAKEKGIRRKTRLLALKDFLKLIKGAEIDEPFTAAKLFHKNQQGI